MMFKQYYNNFLLYKNIIYFSKCIFIELTDNTYYKYLYGLSFSKLKLLNPS